MELRRDTYSNNSTVTNFYLKMFETVVLEGKTIAGGNAYYFPTGGDIPAKEFMTKIAEALHEFGALPSAEIIRYTPEELAKVHFSVLVGCPRVLTCFFH